MGHFRGSVGSRHHACWGSRTRARGTRGGAKRNRVGGRLTNTERLSPGHYLYVNGALKTARQVKVGDTLTTAAGTVTTVTKVDPAVQARGLYVIMRRSGDIFQVGVFP